MLLADYITLHSYAKIQQQLSDNFGLDISEGTIRSWAYYRNGGVYTYQPKPVAVKLSGNKIKDIVMLETSLIQRRLERHEAAR